MSLMGYTEQDVEYMQASVNLAFSLLSEKDKKELKEGLSLTIDLLEGLLVEGRV